MLDRLVHALRRRPVRLVEAAVAVAAMFGIVVADDVAAAATTLLVALVAIGGGEVAQTRTTPTADPMLEHVTLEIDDVGDAL